MRNSLLSRRQLTPELMDDPGLDPGEHRRALEGLRRLNVASAAARRIWVPIQTLADELGCRRLRVLDLACGGGDVAIGLWQLARRSDCQLEILGCDISRVAIDVARSRAAATGAQVDFEVHDVFANLPADFDVVMNSLFLHHLNEPDAIRLLRGMASAARQLVLVDDLSRSRWAYATVWLGAHLLCRSPIVRVDGPRSVANAFSPREAASLFAQAGMHSVQMRGHWPCRWLAVWRRA